MDKYENLTFGGRRASPYPPAVQRWETLKREARAHDCATLQPEASLAHAPSCGSCPACAAAHVLIERAAPAPVRQRC